MNAFRIQASFCRHNAPQAAARVFELNSEGGEAVDAGEADPGQLGREPRPLHPPYALVVQELV